MEKLWITPKELERWDKLAKSSTIPCIQNADVLRLIDEVRALRHHLNPPSDSSEKST